MAKKQFDLSEIRVDLSLQGTTLASFLSRVVAFAVDWAIILFAAKHLWITVLLAFALITAKNRGKLPIIDELLSLLDEQLNHHKHDRAIRYKAIKYARIYAYAWIYVLLGLSILVGVGVLSGAFYLTVSGFVDSHANDEGLFIEYLEGLYNVFAILGGTAGAILYFSIFTWKWKGQTPAKRLLKIRVVKLNGQPLSLWNSFERVSGYASSASLAFTGFLQYYWDRNHQTTHDKISETIVIRDRKENSTPMETTAFDAARGIDRM